MRAVFRVLVPAALLLVLGLGLYFLSETRRLEAGFAQLIERNRTLEGELAEAIRQREVRNRLFAEKLAELDTGRQARNEKLPSLRRITWGTGRNSRRCSAAPTGPAPGPPPPCGVLKVLWVLKCMRMVIGIKSAIREVRLIFSPNTVLSIFVGGRRVPDTVVRSVSGFFILYLSIWALGALVLSIGGPDLITTATASAATIGNIGPGLRAVGPTANYAFFGSFDKLLMIVLMWIGRLEVYAIAALFMRSFWRP